jgi:hypothetical protein
MAHSAAAKQPLAFRVLPRTLEHLKRRAREAGQPQTALAERYIEEGLRMDEHPLIYLRDETAGRRCSAPDSTSPTSSTRSARATTR